ncbi:ABC transporter substrate-binding protein [Chitinasiproducens palmae]
MRSRGRAAATIPSRVRSATLASAVAIGLALLAAPAWADVKVGVVLSLTGPAASLGQPAMNTLKLMPSEMNGTRVQYIVLDDATDTTRAVTDVRKLINEEHVDLIIGPSVSPNAFAIMPVAAEAKTPVISLASSMKIVIPLDGPRKWAYKFSQHDSQNVDALVAEMKRQRVKTVAAIGFADSYGEGMIDLLKQKAPAAGIQVVADERYAKNDASVTAQVLRMLAKKPDAVFIGASGTAGALPELSLAERGYRGGIYQTQGVANKDFLRVCGKACDGTFVSVGPVMVADQLPPNHPTRQVGLSYTQRYDAQFGAGSATAQSAGMWDSFLAFQRVLPGALAKAKPGTTAFREALRQGLEQIRELPVTHGVINTSPTDHQGMDARAMVVVRIEKGNWKLVSP